MTKVRYPFGPADVITVTDGDLSSVAIQSNRTILEISGLTGAETLNLGDLSEDAEIITGSELSIVVSQGATGRNVTLGTGFHAGAPDLTGVANDVDVLELFFNGTSFVPKTAAWNKIVDAV